MKQATISTDNITLIVLNYGAIIQKLLVKDKNGNYQNVVVGYDYPSLYPSDKAFLGACIGRYAGRISNSQFTLDRQNYPLYSERGVHLHGGKEGFGKKYWTIDKVHKGKTPYIKLSYLSKHLEEGYPGNLKTTVTYTLIGNQLQITHEATTDFTTVINLTNHSYFKLDDADSVNQYELYLNCNHMVETKENLLPTGNILSVKDTDYDFTTPKKIAGQPLDTAFVINSKSTETVAKAYSKKSKLAITVKTNQPAVIVYTPPHFPSICFETQNFPDSPNQPSFPNCILRRGETYLNDTTYGFSFEEPFPKY